MNKYNFMISGLVWLLLSCNSSERPQNDGAAEFVKTFYTNYNTEWNIDSGYTLKRRLDSLQRMYCTENLLKKIKQPDLDYDPVIGNIGTDMDFLKTLKVTKDSTKPNTYLVTYMAHGIDPYNREKGINEPVRLTVTVVQINGNYKIDDIR